MSSTPIPRHPQRRPLFSFTPVARAALLFAAGFLSIVVPLDIIERRGGIRHLNEFRLAPFEANIATAGTERPTKAVAPPPTSTSRERAR
jgi:hypothetical protein